jgi:hypothetical protein
LHMVPVLRIRPSLLTNHRNMTSMLPFPASHVVEALPHCASLVVSLADILDMPVWRSRDTPVDRSKL